MASNIPETEAVMAKDLRFLALGDSYTIGEAVPEDERWPVQLADALAAAGCPVAAPTIIAQTGWTVAELAARLDATRLAGPWSLVSLAIGVNDQYRGGSPIDFGAEYAQMLERAIGFAGGEPSRVIALTIPDWGVTPFASRDPRGGESISAEVAAFNAVVREVAIERGVALIDIEAGSRAAGVDASLLAGDGLHPSGQLYAQWVAAVLPEARRILGCVAG